MSLRKHCDGLQAALAELIRPELDQHDRGGPHIVLGSETGLSCDGTFYGLTSPKMGLWLRDEIPNWQNGPAMLLDDSLIFTDCGGDVESAELVCNAVAAHELSHCLLVPGLCRDAGLADERERALFPLAVSESAADYGVDFERLHHGPEFIRLAMHVRWRMIQHDWLVPFCDIADWPRYGSHPGERYRMALKDEFRRLQDLPLSEITSIPARDEFAKLFDESPV